MEAIGKDKVPESTATRRDQCSHIRGFNYHPSYGTCALELWQNFDEENIRYEFNRGKELFPWMNAVRFWLDWNSYLREPKRFLENFEKALAVFEGAECRTMPVLFNRWHRDELDYGGIYMDHFQPSRDPRGLFEPYVHDIIRSHAGDERIFMWDLCNEPRTCSSCYVPERPWEQGEYEWLKMMAEETRSCNPSQPVCIGTHGTDPMPMIRLFEPLVDVLIVHPYDGWEEGEGGRMDVMFKELMDYAAVVGKPVLSSETCWGSMDDAERGRCIEGTLALHRKHGVGWLAYAMWTSLVADLHGPNMGPVSFPGNLAFILPDGSLRPHHEIIHKFAGT